MHYKNIGNEVLILKEGKINIFNSYIKSIFDFNSYNFFYKRSLGRAFLYLFFLTIVLGGLSIVRPLYNLNSMFDKFTTNYTETAPEFNFKDGVLDVTSDVPLIYGDSQMGFIIDTSGKTTISSLKGYASGMLVTKSHIYQKDVFGNVKDLPLSSFKVISFDKNSIEKDLPNLRLIMSILLIAFYPIRFFLGYLLNALILSLMALSLHSFIRSKTTFKDFYKLSIYALTLSTTFNLIITSIDRPVSSMSMYLTLIFYGVGIVYIVKALSVIKLNEITKTSL